jgi:hypothetical protein
MTIGECPTTAFIYRPFHRPSVLFFALTGSTQLFNLHESHGNYRPPAIGTSLVTVHADSKTFARQIYCEAQLARSAMALNPQ